MSVLRSVVVISVIFLQMSCGAGPQEVSAPPEAVTPVAMTSPPGISPGPWEAHRLRVAEEILKSPPRNDLDRQRQALAAAYIRWGEALFKGFGAAATPSPPALGEAPSALSTERPSADTAERPLGPSGSSPLPPLWYWNEKQQQQLDQTLQRQRDQYYRERQAPPQFQRPPICNSYQVGDQVYTQCY